MASNTTFILVPGAWHPAASFNPIIGPLKDAGYDVRAIELPSFATEPPLDDFRPDVDLISREIEDAADKGQDVVVFMHSYGGIVGAESCRGLGRQERKASGKTGGVVRLVYCCAFMVEEGFSLMDMLNHQPLPWFLISEDGARVSALTPETIFYNDLGREEAQRNSDTLAHHSYRCMSTKVTYAAFKDIPTTYLHCTMDNSIIMPVQEKMVEGARRLGGDVETVTFEASHSPFLSMPGQVVTACRVAAGEKLQ